MFGLVKKYVFDFDLYHLQEEVRQQKEEVLSCDIRGSVGKEKTDRELPLGHRLFPKAVPFPEAGIRQGVFKSVVTLKATSYSTTAGPISSEQFYYQVI